MEAIAGSKEVKTLKCSHKFHSQCLDEWRSGSLGDVNQRCPVCRNAMSSASIIPLPTLPWPEIPNESSSSNDVSPVSHSTRVLEQANEFARGQEQGNRFSDFLVSAMAEQGERFVDPPDRSSNPWRFRLTLVLIQMVGTFIAILSAVIGLVPDDEGKGIWGAVLLAIISSCLVVCAAVIEKCLFGAICGYHSCREGNVDVCGPI